MKTVYIFVNGIMNRPGSASGWTDRACTWIGRNLDGAHAEKFEYLALPLTRRLLQNRRAGHLAELIAQFDGAKIVLVGHSNGCDLICLALRKLAFLDVAEAHLISPACSADFSINGLNLALYSLRLGRVKVYVGEKDRAMRLAHWSGKILGLVGLGYGTLGLNGPINVQAENVANVSTVYFSDFDHSTVFEAQNFDRLMRSIVGQENKQTERPLHE